MKSLFTCLSVGNLFKEFSAVVTDNDVPVFRGQIVLIPLEFRRSPCLIDLYQDSLIQIVATDLIQTQIEDFFFLHIETVNDRQNLWKKLVWFGFIAHYLISTLVYTSTQNIRNLVW